MAAQWDDITAYAAWPTHIDRVTGAHATTTTQEMTVPYTPDHVILGVKDVADHTTPTALSASTTIPC